METDESPTQQKFDTYDDNKELSPDELYDHFKIRDKDKVTMKDYRDHIKWHCEHKKFNPYYLRI